MKKPNFFILGAPKCGTSSLAGWLAEHPQVYMSPVKEPHFFNTDETPYVRTPSLKHYQRLFKKVSLEHKAIGEASVWYFYSRKAVANILDYAPNARLVVCLRNPVDMAHSLHEQHVISGNEHIHDFERAWRLQEERSRGRAVARWCREARRLVYGKVCALGEQLARLYQQADRGKVLPLVLDDVRENPRREYLKVVGFLQVDDDGRSDFPIYNAAKMLRSVLLQKAIIAASRIKRDLGVYRRFGFASSMSKINMRNRPRAQMSCELRLELQQYFARDVEKLGRLLGRDLTYWVRQ